MAKKHTFFICSDCGSKSPKWLGRCPDCGEFGTMNEEVYSVKSNGKKTSIPKVVNVSEVTSNPEIRLQSGIQEFDRVCGGGMVAGSMVLVGGEPGIGKSTLLMQVCSGLAKNNKVLYTSGEESVNQVSSRCLRLGCKEENLFIASLNRTDELQTIMEKEHYDLLVVDSIQTMTDPSLDSSAGTVSQVRESASTIFDLAKQKNIPVIIIGHVTKEGAIAGPRILEHMVDVVLYFEGDRNYQYRILRAVKNRYGSTEEIGIFTMASAGLVEVNNPSELFIGSRTGDQPGSVVFPAREGSRIILVEVQALVSTTHFANPRRVSNGIDSNRLSMLLAVLEKKLGYPFSGFDVYVNVTGGFKVSEPASDLAVACAVISSYKNYAISIETSVFGEIGLCGEIRGVSLAEKRISELSSTGFKNIYSSFSQKGFQCKEKISLKTLNKLEEIVDLLF